MTRILVVDDEVKLLRLIRSLFEEHGHEVQTSTRAEEAERILERELIDLLVTDVRLPRRSGIDLLRRAVELQPEMQTIVMSAYGTVSGAVEAMRIGAFDYLLKPFEMEGLLLIAQRALESTRLLRENRYLRSCERSRQPGHRLVADSPVMRQVRQLAEKVAPIDSTVLLTGESGVGKERVAEVIHESSPRSGSPLIRVNCPAIPRDLVESELFGHVQGAFTGARGSRKGKFEIADGGTLFLDEIGDLPAQQQGKLLHVLENRSFSRVGSSEEIRVDVRILAATNQDLEERVEQGEFRADLYYRLKVFPICVPPLRERREDLPGLLDELLCRLSHRLGRPGLRVASDVPPLLERYPWPGNVRELRNVLERAAVLAGGDEIQAVHLPVELIHPPSSESPRDSDGPDSDGPVSSSPAPSSPGLSLADSVERYKVQLVLSALRARNWKKKEAARQLGLTPRALSHYVQRYDLDRYRDDVREPGDG